jgi:hypothetical protein
VPGLWHRVAVHRGVAATGTARDEKWGSMSGPQAVDARAEESEQAISRRGTAAYPRSKFRPMHQWARNKLNENPGGVVDVLSALK